MPHSVSHSTWHGFARLDFTMEGRNATLVAPRKAAAGNPYIWRTEFFGHEPQLDMAMLASGWHLAYIAVSDMYGAPPAIAAMQAFQDHVESAHHLAPRPALEGMSRGGLYAFNYAAANPSRVGALYLDNPVLDIRSWPGGLYNGPGSPACWEECLQIYGLTPETAVSFNGNPLDHVTAVAEAKIPIVLVCGDADEVVPYPENGALLAQRYQELGAPLQLILKPGGLHHPHCLPDPAPIARFLLDHTSGA